VSVWSRIRTVLTGADGEPTPPATVPAPSVPHPNGIGTPERPLSALEQLGVLARAGEGDEERALALFTRASEDGLELEAIDHARRLLERSVLPTLAQRVAERLDARGDEVAAAAVLAPIVSRPDAPLDALMLAAEIAERRLDPARALSFYERIIARDLAYPRARERAFRLREARLEGADRRPDTGATLMGDGALARGRFRVLSELGRGGAGTVFLAEDVPLGRHVALKIYQRRGRTDRERMLHEARLPATLAHPAIVRVLDVDESINAIAMELAAGSLRTELGRGPLDVAFIRRVIARAAEALAFVHGAGWAHRDMKPSNLLLDAAGNVVLTDFGIAARIGEPRPKGEGSLGYLAPEQRAGEPTAGTMDVHALGATLAELLVPLGSSAPEDLVSLSRAAMRTDPSARPKLDRFRTT
jgi:predicted Ser/Thr protein kinase